MPRERFTTPTGDLDTAFRTIRQSLHRARLDPNNVEDFFGQIDMDASGKIVRTPSLVDKEGLVTSVTGSLRPGYYVEIGVGPENRRIPRKFTTISPYVAYDGTFTSSDIGGRGSAAIRDDAHARILTDQFRVANDQNPNLTVRLGDGRSLPLSDGSVQEVFMGNVLLSPSTNIQTMVQLLSEAKRVLDPQTGVFVIGEHEIMHDLTEQLVLLDMLLARVGFERNLVSADKIDSISDALGWPANPVDRIGTQFVIAKPIAEAQVSARRGFLRRR